MIRIHGRRGADTVLTASWTGPRATAYWLRSRRSASTGRSAEALRLLSVVGTQDMTVHTDER
jgi:hypothetical protein